MSPNIRAGLRLGKLPYLVAEEVFTATENAVIHDCIVHVGKERFLIIGFYHPALPVNRALNDLASGFRWKGELILFTMGKRVPYLSNVSRPKAREAVNQFMAGFLQHYHMNKEIPSGMVSPF
ncbi:hypothetical protein C8R47DRAFT_1084462 [Mycena vitilis]|nr:hypothetical protein C8R47DRAFT_1230300 [Mycena vitilis]KAJ6450341.1 hypothetical protein C8R47DRAFT_1084462 [Mycena vitilis]